MNTIISAIAILLIASTVIFSQEADNSTTITRPVQIGFVTPLGTNGMQSWEVTNNFSLNMLIGYSGGVNGVEIGGFYNQTKGNIKGLQIGGFANTTMGSTVGCQIAGFSNVNKKDVTGLQIGGFSNVVADSASAVQISGFSNLVNGSLTGLQLAGFSNVSKSIPTGAQIAGFSNVNKGDMTGIQIAGFSNVNTKTLKGVQIGGFYNYTKKLNGAQIGFINICDTVEEGIALGFLSIVKNGYRALEISGNESFYAVGSFKTGTKRFYNIISIGSRLENNFITWGWGYGIGTMIQVNEKIDINIDGIAYHINEDEWWTGRLNMLNKINLSASVQLFDQLTVFGGITWNVLVSDIYDNEGFPVNTSIVNWSAYDKTTRNTNVKMYPGFTLGVRFNQ